ncbi:MAG: transcriptional repressor [Muribaculaceae bacterium]|nr:transcriptional repressor [Muribaculaceae bacterium]
MKMKEHGIRPTAVRLMIGRVLDSADHPMSSLEIEMALDTVDRSTITRTLAIFGEKSLIHIIEDGSGASKYEICTSDHEETSSDMHLHFHCRKCGQTNCLPIPIPDVNLPGGFKAETANFTITGLCDKCNR